MKASPVRWDPRDARPPRRENGRGSGRSGGEDNLFLSLSPERARVLLIVAARASSYTIVVIVALVLVTLFAADSAMTGASGAIAAGWLAVHQVPLVIGRTTLSLLPLVPTGLVLWLTARDCARAVEPRSSRADLGWILGAALTGPLLVTAICLAVAGDASSVVALQPPEALAAFAWVGGLHLAAALFGLAVRPNPLRDKVIARIPLWVESAARIAVRAVWRLLLCAAVLTLLSFLLHWSRIGETYSAAGNFGGVLGLSVLSLAYLPNTVIGATGVLVGAQLHIGVGGLSVFAVSGASVPALPILAAVPTGPAAGWWPVVLAVPAAVGVLTGRDCARGTYDQPLRPWATLTTAAFAAVLLGVLGGIAGGVVGSFGEIGTGIFLFGGLGFAWLAAAGYLGLIGSRWFLAIPAARLVDEHEYAADAAYADDDQHEEYAEDGYADDAYYEPVEDDHHYEDHHYDEPEYPERGPGGPGYRERVYEYDDLDYGRYARLADRDVEEIDGELVEEQAALGPADDPDDILDAEVVETDLPEGRRWDGS
ncbi:cell division protein PerM [Nocardia macrotermitis]|uniref:Uncharacterized protein n=1 Tax=Nocardia macrotermitis TaxID=2585198 RepID=A0A7K0D086_9NOCA|nr:DUF6350 family protein [Nocardia macrotermitis]MQY19130.1 hypothetical protein [Nocardia macrotermitis]